jgi:SAM-dependent methyltransferase
MIAGVKNEHELHRMDPKSRFTKRAEAYARHRPDYPQALFDALEHSLGSLEKLTIADLGAGTGISSRQLAERGARVLAVEPNLAMREAAATHPRVQWTAGSAEETGLEAGSVDLVCSFQAFHWFEVSAALAEARRILAAGGHLALVWNERDQADPFSCAYSEVVRRLSGRHPAERRAVLDRIPLRENGFELLSEERFPHRQIMDLDGVLGRAASTSYLPEDGPGREQVVAQLGELYRGWQDQHGEVRLVYQTSLCLARAAETG